MADKLLGSIKDSGDNRNVTTTTQVSNSEKHEAGQTSQTTTRTNEGVSANSTQRETTHQTQDGTSKRTTARALTESSSQTTITAEKTHIGCEVAFVIPIRGGLGVVPALAAPAPSPCD